MLAPISKDYPPSYLRRGSEKFVVWVPDTIVGLLAADRKAVHTGGKGREEGYLCVSRRAVDGLQPFCWLRS
jgi:hypothetical protein